MGSCCQLTLELLDDGTLVCHRCQVPVRKEKREDSGRCVIKHYCPKCGADMYPECGARLRVIANRPVVIRAEL